MREVNLKKFLHILLALVMPVMLCAQQPADNDPIRVYFRVGSSVVEAGYMDNAAALEELATRLEPCVHDSLGGKGRVRISSSVSPEGSDNINERLIKARAKSISDWVSKQFNVEVGYIVESMGVDWALLIDKVEASDKVPFKAEVLEVLNNTPEKTIVNGKTTNERQNKLARLRGGEPYRYILKNIYPSLRYAAAYTDIWIVPEITVTSPEQMLLSAQGGEGVITYQREERDEALPMVSCDSEWVYDLLVGNSDVTFKVQPNTMAKSRRASVVLNHYDIAQSISIEQEAAEASLTFTSPTSLEAEAAGGRYAVSFTTNTDEEVVPEVLCDVDWISDVKATGNRVSFTVSANSIAEARRSSLRVNALGKTFEVEVGQKAATPKSARVDEADDAVTTPQFVLDKSESIKVYFRQGSATIDQKYMNNGDALKRLSDLLQPYVVEGATNKGTVRIISSASPEGSNAVNERLVKARAGAISNWISKRFDVEIGNVVESMGVDWATLITLVEENDNVPYKEEVLDILYNTPERVTRNGKVINERENKLEALRKGEPYRYILKNIYPSLRYAAAYTEIWYASELTITSECPIVFTHEGGKGVITFEKNVEDKVVPRITTTADWIGSVVAEGDKVGVEIAENTMADERASKIYIECYGQVYEVEVVQEGAEPVMTITSEKENGFGAEGGEGVINFSTNTTAEVVPEAESGSEWISDIVATSEAITYNVIPNEIAEPRSDTIRVKCFDTVQEVVVNQEGAKPALTFLSEPSRNIPSDGAVDSVYFKTNSPVSVVPTALSNSEWISKVTTTDSLITYKVDRNRNTEPRTGTVTVGCFGDELSLVVNQAGATDCGAPFYAALKTNALYDAALIPNIGAEIALGKHFSVSANWHYAWWKSDAIRWYWRTYGGDLSARFWFGESARRKPLTGHHIGLYGQIVTYDFLVASKNGILADRWSWDYGVEYGYSWPLTERLNLDCTLGVGYHTGQFHEYMVIDNCYVWQATKNRKYVGPTKLEVSLVWLFGCKNTNQMEGGDR